MPLRYDPSAWERAEEKVVGFLGGLDEDLRTIGEIAAKGIVQSTLAGIGPDDNSFAPYSPEYQKLIDSVGGKPQGTVNLRGIFLKEGQRNPKFRSNERRRLSGAGRQAYIQVSRGGKTFTAKTPLTRPAMGLTDPLSEMSLDLIQISTTNQSVTLTYNPREKEYMLFHQSGDGKLPKREWFTLSRTNIQTAIHTAILAMMQKRVDRFNSPN